MKHARLEFAFRVSVVAAVVVLLSVPSAEAGFASLSVQSDSGSFLGGNSYDLFNVSADAVNTVSLNSMPNGSTGFTNVTFTVHQSADVEFVISFNSQLVGVPLTTLGTFGGATQFPGSPDHPGISVVLHDHGQTLGAGTPVGEFTVTQVQLQSPYPPNGQYQVESFKATFRQLDMSGGSTDGTAVYGTIVYSATALPEPSSLVLCGAAGLVGLGVASARRLRAGARS